MIDGSTLNSMKFQNQFMIKSPFDKHDGNVEAIGHFDKQGRQLT